MKTSLKVDGLNKLENHWLFFIITRPAGKCQKNRTHEISDGVWSVEDYRGGIVVSDETNDRSLKWTPKAIGALSIKRRRKVLVGHKPIQSLSPQNIN